MRRHRLAVIGLACGAIWFLTGAALGQAPPPMDVPSRALAVLGTDISQLRQVDGLVTEGARSGTLRMTSVVQDPMVPAHTTERYQQFYLGVPIWGADVVRDTDRGVATSVFGVFAPELTLSVEPSLTSEAAEGIVRRIGGTESVLLVAPEVVVAPLDNGDYRLAYTAVVSGGGGVTRVFVDANTGAELLRYSEIHWQQAAVGSGTGVLGDRKKLSVESRAGTYIAYDRHRPPIIETFDMRGNLTRTKLLLNGRLPYLFSDLASDADNVWTDAAVVDAHVHVSWTYDYYYKRFGRSGLDGRNGPIDILVNPVSQQDAPLLADEDLGLFALNAFWCGVCGPGGQGLMAFGSGLPSNLTFGGQTWTHLSGALDAAAHELTHGVISATSNLIPRNESGALNEAFSDMMAKGVEFFYHPPGSGAGQADYVIGKDVVRAGRAGAMNGLRSMANPSLYGDPDHYSRYVRLPATAAGDYGGIHINMGIPNQAFYLAIEGGINRTSGRAVQGVGAANREQIERVFYRAFTLLMPASATFSTARAATIQASRDLYGADSAVERAVTQAWDAVGVSTVVVLPTLDNALPSTGDRSFYYYVIEMTATGRYQAILNWTDPGIDLDLMIGPVGCSSYSCMLARADGSAQRPETVCLDVRAGERYWVAFQNFSSRTATFQLTQTIDPTPTGPCTVPGPALAPTAGATKNGADDAMSAYQLN